jgi:hypothetical protein
MSFTTGAYFKNEIRIPNILENGSYTTEITDAITKYETECRIDLLGYELNKLLEADLSEGIPQTQRFKDLVNGAEFTHPDTGQLLKWIGFVNNEKESLLAYYIYYNYVYNDNIHLSGVGSVNVQPENAVKVSPFDKLQIAWSKFLKLYSGFDYSENEYFSENGSEVSSLPGTFNTLPSAYNFLYANKENYPEWIFKPQYNKNIFSL